MGRPLYCQHCGVAITIGSVEVGGKKRKLCLKICKIALKHVVAKLMDDHWMSSLLGEKDVRGFVDSALHYRGSQEKAAQIGSVSPYLCPKCNAKAEADAEAEAVAAITAIKLKVDAAIMVATAATVANREAEARAYRLMLTNRCFICVFVFACFCAWCSIRG